MDAQEIARKLLELRQAEAANAGNPESTSHAAKVERTRHPEIVEEYLKAGKKPPRIIDVKDNGSVDPGPLTRKGAERC